MIYCIHRLPGAVGIGAKGVVLVSHRVQSVPAAEAVVIEACANPGDSRQPWSVSLCRRKASGWSVIH